MPALVPFSLTTTLGAAAASLTLSGIPASANHLLVVARARSDDQATAGLWLGLRLNGDAGPNTYDGNTLRFVSASAGGTPGDGIDLEQFALSELVPNDTAAGIFGQFLGLIPRYQEAEPHVLMGVGFSRPDNLDNTDANFGTYVAGGQHSVAAAVTSLQLLPQTGNLAPGSSLTVVGLLGAGDATNVARSAQVGTVLDFAGAAIKDVTLTPGANTFTATNLRLGRTLYLRVSGGDGTTTIALPAGTEVLSNSYVAGSPAWIALQCMDEGGPGYIASIRDVL